MTPNSAKAPKRDASQCDQSNLSAEQPQRKIPDFFFVGHPKCGTTALLEMLRSHPGIYLPDTTGHHPLAAEFRAQSRGSVGLPETLDDHLSMFDAASSEQRIGDASRWYLWSRTAASRIAGLQPDTRIIAMLREPASFLRSLHLQFVRGLAEPEKDFRKAFALEDTRRQMRHRLHDPANWPQLVLAAGALIYSDHVRYVDQLRRYQALFPPENLLVLIYDDFRRDNEATVRTVLRFLDVDDTAPIPMTETHPSVSVRSRHLNNLVDAVHLGQGPVSRATKALFKVLVPSRRLRSYVIRASLYTNPPPPDDGLMVELRRRFKPEVVALSEYLDCDLVRSWGYHRIG